MSFFKPEISEDQSVASAVQPIPDFRDIVSHAVNARRHLGQSEAVYQVARELRIKPRRVLGILRGEILRYWSDEVDHARAWYVAECDRMAEALDHEAATIRARRSAIQEKLNAGLLIVDRATALETRRAPD